MNDPNDILWETAAAAAKLSVGLQARLSRKAPPEVPGAYGLVSLKLGSRTLRMPCVVCFTVTASILHSLEQLAKRSKQGLFLVTDHVPTGRADSLRRAGIQFMDAAGNVYLESPGSVFAFAVGRRPNPAMAKLASNKPKAFHNSGLKLIFALLTDPRLDDAAAGAALVGRSYREVGAATGLAHSTVGWIMADLIRIGYVAERGDGTRILANRRRLVERWVQGYVENLRPKLVLDRYTPERMDWWQDAQVGPAKWTGEVAAAKLTGMLKPGTYALYGDRPTHELVLRHGLQKDPRGSVEYLQPFWSGAAPVLPTPECVHPLLVYADLLAIDDDRTREAAQAVYEHHLRRSIEAS